MTTIAALADGQTVWMAADSCTNVYNRPLPGAARKIRRLHVGDDTALLGYCGDGALPSLIDASLTVERPDNNNDLDTWANAVARAITELAVDAGLVEEGHLDGSVLLGFRGRLWVLTHMQAVVITDGICTLGSGEGPAIGVLDALVGTRPADQLVRLAVELACHRDRYSEPPVFTETITEKQTEAT